MAIVELGVVREHQAWPQGDVRDPLGTWGIRHGVTGDASGGSIKVRGTVDEDKQGAFVYTCYYAMVVQLTGAPSTQTYKTRLLTSWPNVDVIPGIQAVSTYIAHQVRASTPTFTPPISGPREPDISPNDRFLLLYDPRQSGGPTEIIEWEYDLNLEDATYSFEAYGYYWDRSVLQAPGGPRHPGSS